MSDSRKINITFSFFVDTRLCVETLDYILLYNVFILTESVDGKGEFDPSTLYCSFCENIFMEHNTMYIECPETNKQKCKRG